MKLYPECICRLVEKDGTCVILVEWLGGFHCSKLELANLLMVPGWYLNRDSGEDVDPNIELMLSCVVRMYMYQIYATHKYLYRY